MVHYIPCPECLGTGELKNPGDMLRTETYLACHGTGHGALLTVTLPSGLTVLAAPERGGASASERAARAAGGIVYGTRPYYVAPPAPASA